MYARGGSLLFSDSGFQQGDPLGPLLFSLAARSDPPLSPKGQDFAKALPRFVEGLRREQNLTHPLFIWTSPRIRSLGTASNFMLDFNAGPVQIFQKSALVEFNPGAIDGLTESEIIQKFPQEHNEWKLDAYNYRFPRAESYHDLAVRLESILLELEREKDDLLIIAHPTVLKCIYAYVMDKSEQDIVKGIQINNDEIIELIPVAYGCKETRYSLNL